jgi:hypothetical protein
MTQQPSNENAHDVTSSLLHPLDTKRRKLTDHRRRGLLDILTASMMVSAPFIILSAVLLGVVTGFRVVGRVEFAGPTPSAFYLVSLNAATIALIASYSSTFTSIAVGFAMTLLFYIVLKDFVKYSEQKQLDNLPTPYQVGLLIILRGGGFASLWQWFKYTFQWKMRQKISRMLKTSTAGVGVAILLG